MSEFQCSSSWGYPKVIRLKYQAYRNYSGLSFSFDKISHTIYAESTRIRDPRVRCFSWRFESDADVEDDLDKLVAAGRLAELSCKKMPYAVPAFWNADVEFEGKVNSCSSSSEYPFSVLAFEEGLMGLMDDLGGRMNADIADSCSIHVESTCGENHLELRIVDWKEMSIGGKGPSGMVWKTTKLSEENSDSIVSIFKDYPFGRPMNNLNTEGSDVGTIIIHYPKGSYRLDFEGELPAWWIQFCERISNFISNLNDF